MFRVALLIAAVIGIVLAASAEPPREGSVLSPRPAKRDNEERLRSTLKSARVSADFAQVPLRQAVTTLIEKAGITNFVFKTEIIETDGISLETPFTGKLSNVTLEAALRQILPPHGLTSYVKDEMLVIVTDIHEEMMSTRFHDIRELRAAFAKAFPTRPPRVDRDGVAAPLVLGSRYPEEVEDLIELVLQETEGPWEDLHGSGGTVMPAGPSLIIRQSERVHAEIESVLRNMTAFVKGPPKVSLSPLLLTGERAATWHKQWDALGRLIGPLRFSETPLDQAVAQLAEMSGTSIVIYAAALAEEGVKVNEPVTFSAGKITFRSASNGILGPFGLSLFLADGVFKVTSQVKADELRLTILHDTRDLVKAGIDAQKLIDLLEQQSSGPWESIDGSGGTIAVPLPGALIVRQTLAVHDEVADLLFEFRESLTKGQPAGGLGAANGTKDEEPLVVRFYPLHRKGIGEQLQKTIVTFVAPDSWAATRGEGVIAHADETLIIRQTPAVHRQITRFLDDLQNAKPVTPKTIRGF